MNPGGRPPVGPDEGEGRMAALLRELLAGWGAEVEIREAAPGRPNVLARFRGRDDTRSLMLDAHSDTVPPGAMSVPPYAGEVRDGKLFGRGSCDDKGPMAAMLLGLKQALDAGGAPPVTTWFVATCDEELGAGGARALMADGFRPTAAIVGEPTGLNVLVAHKGAVRWRVTTKGVSAHRSAPERGRNAVVMMGRVLERIEAGLRPTLTRRVHPLLGAPTVSVGVIRGGTQVNVVPARCEIEVDRRLNPGERPQEAGAELEELLAGLRRDDPGFDAEWVETNAFPAFEEAADSAIARLALGACREVRGRAEVVTAPWA